MKATLRHVKIRQNKVSGGKFLEVSYVAEYNLLRSHTLQKEVSQGIVNFGLKIANLIDGRIKFREVSYIAEYSSSSSLISFLKKVLRGLTPCRTNFPKSCMFWSTVPQGSMYLLSQTL